MADGRPKVFLTALLSGILVGIISAVPYFSALNCCCFWFILGGFWAGFIIWKESGNLPVGTGIGTGFLTGIFAAMVYSVLSTILFSLSSESTLAQMQEVLSQTNQDIPPEFVEVMEQLIQSPFVAFLVIFAFSILVFPLGGLFGGLIASLIFGKRKVS
ncbi:hypothetical protein J7K99_06945 [bacterium]|nr:hypothetical protein [bacterium]